MNLLIYACCKASDRLHLAESSVRVELAQPPALNDIVSMGRQKRWVVVEIAAYKPVGLRQEIQAVYLVHLQREDLPLAPRSEWSFFQPQETVQVQLSAVNEPALQLGFNVLGQPPRIGDRVMPDQPVSNFKLVRSIPKAWLIDRYDTYLPENQAPYSAVYLAWCCPEEGT